jgi:hypothetical protein
VSSFRQSEFYNKGCFACSRVGYCEIRILAEVIMCKPLVCKQVQYRPTHMNDQPVSSTEVEESRPLTFTYPTFKDMQDNNIIFVYKGLVNSDLVTHVLEIMEEKLEEDNQSKRLSKKVFNVMVECLTGMYSDELLDNTPGYDPTTVLLVKRDEDSYVVTTGHYIHNSKVSLLKNTIDKINSLSPEQIKHMYQEILTKEDPSAMGLTDLAVVDLARKSKHKLNYQFKYISSDFTFFSLESRISKQSI